MESKKICKGKAESAKGTSNLPLMTVLLNLSLACVSLSCCCYFSTQLFILIALFFSRFFKFFLLLPLLKFMKDKCQWEAVRVLVRRFLWWRFASAQTRADREGCKKCTLRCDKERRWGVQGSWREVSFCVALCSLSCRPYRRASAHPKRVNVPTPILFVCVFYCTYIVCIFFDLVHSDAFNLSFILFIFLLLPTWVLPICVWTCVNAYLVSHIPSTVCAHCTHKTVFKPLLVKHTLTLAHTNP